METAIVDVIFQGAAILIAVFVLAVAVFGAAKLGFDVTAAQKKSIRRTVQGFVLAVEEKYLRAGAEAKLGEVLKRMRQKWPVLHMLGILNPTVDEEIVNGSITTLAPLGIGAAGKQYLDRVKKTPPASGLTAPVYMPEQPYPGSGGTSAPAAAGTGG